MRVKAYREGSEEPLGQLRALVSGDWYPQAWSFDGEAMLSPPVRTGEHVVRFVDYTDPDSLQFSDPVMFEAVAEKTEELELHLRPGLSIRGELDAPKPVKAGYVVAHISTAAPGAGSKHDQYISWKTWAHVAENGEFEIHSLPPTPSIAMLGWCEGYVYEHPFDRQSRYRCRGRNRAVCHNSFR